MIAPLPHELELSRRSNPVVSALLDGWAALNLPNCWVVAGSVVQSYWNSVPGYSPLHGISDVDIVYFDPDDLSEAAEAEHAFRIDREIASSPVRLDVKNEARVHLWYEDKFGLPIDPYPSVEAAIDTFPTTAGAIGIRPIGTKIECYTSFGYDDLMGLVVRPNKRQVTADVYADKVARWKSIWPMLKIVNWNDG